MKKILTLIVMSALCLGASAQLRTSRTQYTRTVTKIEVPKEPIRMEWYARAGFTLNNALLDQGNYDHLSTSFSPGFSLEAGFNRFFRGSQFYWGADFGLGTQGCKATGERSFYSSSSGNIYEYTEEFKLEAYTLQITPKIGYQVAIGETTALDFHLGGFVSWSFINAVSGDADDWYRDNAGFQVGPQGGIGIWFNRFNIDISYQYGFLGSEVDSYHDYLGVNSTSNLMLRIGYAF